MSLKAWISRATLGAFLLLAVLSLPARGQGLRFATWNIENFWHVEGESLRGPYQGRDTIRTAQDYAALTAVIARLDADVWALQEMGSPEAARRLFPAEDWQLVFSPRYAPGQPRDIYTALAIRQGIVIDGRGSIPLNVIGTNRMATTAQVRVGEQRIWLASVHLKAGCRHDLLAHSDRRQCQTLGAQVRLLESWIDARLTAPEQGLLIGGDFNRYLMGDNRYFEAFDPVWTDLADADPAPLFAFPFAPNVNCPEGRFGARTWPVEFIVTNAALAARAARGPYTANMGGQALSDHCPVVLTLRP